MISNHIKVAIRNLLRQKGFSFINIVGLALGISCTALIGMWVNDEFIQQLNLGYDKENLLYIHPSDSHRHGNRDTPRLVRHGPMAHTLRLSCKN